MEDTVIEVFQAGEIVNPEDEINEEHRLTVLAGESMLEHAIRCGQLLIEQKARMDHGGFMSWVQEHCNFARQAAQNYMRIANYQSSGNLIHEIEETKQEPTAQLPDLGGATSIAQALRQITAADPPAPKAKKPEQAKPVMAFSWFHQPRVTDMMDAMSEGTIKVGIAYLLDDLNRKPENQQDPVWAYHLSEMVIKLIFDQLEKIVATLYGKDGDYQDIKAVLQELRTRLVRPEIENIYVWGTMRSTYQGAEISKKNLQVIKENSRE
jgi:hypothetical protein